MSSPFLTFEQAVFGLEGRAITVPLTLHVGEGEKLLLDGVSGSGKTSVLRGLLGFLKLQSGRYQIRDASASPAAIWQLRLECAYVSQELEMGNGEVRAWLNRNLPSGKTLHESDFTQLHLEPGIMEKALDEVSRGERQRLAIILALAREPSLFLLDEATSALNDVLRVRVIDLLARSKATVIAVSHDEAWRNSGYFREVTIG